MKTIIAGSRDITDYDTVLGIVANSGFVISEIVSGEARGVDTVALQIAEDFGIPSVRFPPDWERFGRRYAGHYRNADMADYADALIAIWDGVSKGTLGMITLANRRGLTVYYEIVE